MSFSVTGAKDNEFLANLLSHENKLCNVWDVH